MSEKFRIKRVELGMFRVWRLSHSGLKPLGRRYFLTFDGAVRRFIKEASS